VAYDRVVAKVVAAWKEEGLRGTARFAAELVTELVAPPRAAAVTFVPPHRERSLKRGHHAAGRLARELGERWELEVRPLVERSAGRRQRGLALKDRRRNVRGAFHAVDDAPASVVLVDDVYTSGATVAAASTALRRAGARRVEVVTFARAVR
jgi:predicted amidophosphoribosyltransferase